VRKVGEAEFYKGNTVLEENVPSALVVRTFAPFLLVIFDDQVEAGVVGVYGQRSALVTDQKGKTVLSKRGLRQQVVTEVEDIAGVSACTEQGAEHKLRINPVRYRKRLNLRHPFKQ